MNFLKFRQLKKEIVPVLQEGGIGILPTDTLYGIVGSALDEKTVERIYKIRKRNPDKPSIILISNISDIKKFDVVMTGPIKKQLKRIWPGKISAVLNCNPKSFEYLHRGKNSLAFRLPEDRWLRKMLKLTGPLIAPSANFEGEQPAKTKEEAKRYFRQNVDFYVDLGKLESEPSTIVKIEKNGDYSIIREGAVKIQ